jgi:iron complex transport system substrate-binding protein
MPTSAWLPASLEAKGIGRALRHSPLGLDESEGIFVSLTLTVHAGAAPVHPRRWFLRALVAGFFALVLLLAPLPIAATAAAQGATPTPAACAVAATPGAAAATFPLTITDDAGRQVMFAQPPQRIVSIAPSNTEILYALGLADRVVAIDSYSNYPPEAAAKPLVGDYLEPDLESVVAAEPDLILAADVHLGTVLPELDTLDLPTVVFAPANLDEVFASILQVGVIAGEPARAAELVCELQARVDAVTAAIVGAPRPRVFFELDPGLYTVGPETFVADVIARAGGENIAAAAAEMWPQLSAEAIVAANPEVILLADEVAGVTPEQVAARPGWQGIAAVEQDRIVPIDPDLVARPGPRVVDGLEEVAAALHPDRFPEAAS